MLVGGVVDGAAVLGAVLGPVTPVEGDVEGGQKLPLIGVHSPTLQVGLGIHVS